jgi:glycosyltransferase involved in cell wall biosynthesis
MEPFCTVVIPTLNEEHFLPRLLTRLSEQSDHDIEVIVADGGSKDATVAKAHEFDSKLSLRVLQSHKGNVAHQRNLAADMARGTYLFFIDADCMIDVNFISKLRSATVRNPHRMYLPYVQPDQNSWFLRTSYVFMNAIIRFSQNLPRQLSAVGAMAIDRQVFSKVHGYDESIYIGEDHNIVRRVRKLGVRAVCPQDVKIVFSLRRIRQEGMVRSIYILFVGIAHALFFGDIKKDTLFTYEMGGQMYNKPEETS